MAIWLRTTHYQCSLVHFIINQKPYQNWLHKKMRYFPSKLSLSYYLEISRSNPKFLICNNSTTGQLNELEFMIHCFSTCRTTYLKKKKMKTLKLWAVSFEKFFPILETSRILIMRSVSKECKKLKYVCLNITSQHAQVCYTSGNNLKLDNRCRYLQVLPGVCWPCELNSSYSSILGVFFSSHWLQLYFRNLALTCPRFASDSGHFCFNTMDTTLRWLVRRAKSYRLVLKLLRIS